MLCKSKFQYVKVNGRLSYIQVILKNELKTNIFIAQIGINLFVLIPYLHLVGPNEWVSEHYTIIKPIFILNDTLKLTHWGNKRLQ